MIALNVPLKSDKSRVGKYSIDFDEIQDILASDDSYGHFGIEQDNEGSQLRLVPFRYLMAGPPEIDLDAYEASPEVSMPQSAPPVILSDVTPKAPPLTSTDSSLREVESDSEDDEVFQAGQLDYEIPDVMQQNQAVVCTVRIAGAEVALESIRISEHSAHSAIQITKEMSVRLVDPSNGTNFTIGAISSERQAIRRGDFTEWKISVIPLKVGVVSIFLRVSAHFHGKIQDMTVLEKSIRVSEGASRSMEQVSSQIRKKIVFLAADSKSGLLLGRESNKIREELLMSTHRDEFLYTTLFEVTGFDFSRTLLREKPTIVHFSGHGSAQGIFLVNERESPQLASTQALNKLFGVLKRVLKIECLILNACFSRVQAEVVADSIPVVVGTQSKIGDKEAINFSIGFYQGLGEGLAYEDAFELGRVQVSFNSDDPNAEDILTLLKK